MSMMTVQVFIAPVHIIHVQHKRMAQHFFKRTGLMDELVRHLCQNKNKRSFRQKSAKNVRLVIQKNRTAYII